MCSQFIGSTKNGSSREDLEKKREQKAQELIHFVEKLGGTCQPVVGSAPPNFLVTVPTLNIKQQRFGIRESHGRFAFETCSLTQHFMTPLVALTPFHLFLLYLRDRKLYLES